MSETTRAILLSWEIRPLIIIYLVTLGVLYTAGWTRLHGRNAIIAKKWRLFAFWIGLILMTLALISPIEVLSGVSFTMHMVQHLLIAMFAPPLLMAAEPLPMLMWGVPSRIRRGMGRAVFGRKSPIRIVLTMITKPAFTWIAFFVFLWGWHDPNLYNLTLVSPLAHDIEHFTFFWSAMFLWWHITSAAPHFHKRFGHVGRIALAVGSVPANMVAGVVIAMSPRLIYTGYLPFEAFNPFGLSVLDDQRVGGILMWIPGSMMYALAVVILISLWLSAQEKAAYEHSSPKVEKTVDDLKEIEKLLPNTEEV